jgi:hypothetical protein
MVQYRDRDTAEYNRQVEHDQSAITVTGPAHS